MATTRSKLLKLQRQSLRRIHEQIEELEGPAPAEVQRYKKAYDKDVSRPFKVSKKEVLISKVTRAKLVLGGDFHAFAQSQKAHLRVLREIIRKRKIILALEMLSSNSQEAVDAFLSERITERKFLEKIDYHRAWGFPWENYKPLFDFARQHDVMIVGLNLPLTQTGRMTLAGRDRWAARQIVDFLEKSQDSLIYAIYGDLHLAERHIPQEIKKQSQQKNLKAEIITIFQNVDAIYWKLARQQLEEKVDLVELKRNVFCVVNAPPWIKWQSYLGFLETSLEAESSDQIDFHDQISGLISILVEVWGVAGKFDDFAVFGPGDRSVFKAIGSKLDRKQRLLLEECIEKNFSFYFPVHHTLSLSQLDSNHGALLAGQYVHSKQRGGVSPLLDFPGDFLGRIWTEAVGFFSSKIVNHRRKSDTIQDMKQQVETGTDRATTALLVLEFRLREQVAIQGRSFRMPRHTPGRKGWNYLEAARLLGAVLGNRMYLAFVSGRLSAETLKSWLRETVMDNERFREFYLDCMRSLKVVQVQERSKHERL